MKSRWVKGALTVVGAIVLSTLGIYASDRLQGIDGGFGQLANVGRSGVCDAGSVPLKVGDSVICVDMYEASPSAQCPNKTLSNTVQSEQNASTKECFAASVPSVSPWNYVSLPQAQRACANAGKRLPTSEEWYNIALGTDPESCVIDESKAMPTGTEACISGIGTYDTIGNVWEWVNGEVVEGTFNGKSLPGDGYVTSVDMQGIALSVGETADELYGKDYFWSKSEGVFGIIRGGFYGSNDDAGLYTTNASVLTSFAAQGVGFRCVKDIL